MIVQKQYKLEDIVENANMVVKVVRHLKELKLVATRAKELIKKRQEELKDIEAKLYKIKKLEKIDSRSPSFDEDSLIYAEVQSIISTGKHTQDPADSLNHEVTMLLDQLKQDLKGKYKRFNDKENDSPLPIVKIPNKTKAFREARKTIQYKASRNKCNISTEPIISNFAAKNKLEDEVSKFAKLQKPCDICHTLQKFTLMLECTCTICVDCLKKSVIGKEGRLFKDIFEAQKEKQISMCACQKHSRNISPKLLTLLFGSEFVEEQSVAATRRQLEYCELTKKTCPNICVNCRCLLQDTVNAKGVVALCYKHKVCKYCAKKCYSEGKCKFCEVHCEFCLLL
eukprot:TRINITY_DN2954_c0_g2_i7.p1 TRINITY_DN2954_c0_g2~~TRINITY_DN2954_c0_g2_i7.p1  ORF type:complete len:340 (+),score=102.94 TRINITY_DN2954_c0_g2_i7:122-1141(+)